MRSVVFLLAMSSYAQSRPGQCGGSAATAANPGMPARGSESAAKPDAARGKTPPVLAQVRPLPRPGLPPAVSCWCGTVSAAALTSTAVSQEVPIVPGLSGNFRFDHVLLQETKPFSSDMVGKLTVSVGRPTIDSDVIPEYGLKSTTAPYSFLYDRPGPPVITGVYSLVLNFVGSSPLGTGTLSNLDAGSLNWEVCGYQVQ